MNEVATEPTEISVYPDGEVKELIYLASPYSSSNPEKVQRRLEITAKTAARLLAKGFHIYSPILHCHPIAHAGKLPTDAAFWEKYNITFMQRCTKMLVLMLPGWEESKGIASEENYFRSHGKKINYIFPAQSDLD